jgi:hypothetical protein
MGEWVAMKRVILNIVGWVGVTVIFILGSVSYAQEVGRPLTQKTVTAFSYVNKEVVRLNQQYGASNVLVVVDIDNTLLTSSVDLGGDVWYQWQRGKFDIKPMDEQKVQCADGSDRGSRTEILDVLAI